MRKIIRPKYINDTALDVLRRQKVYLCADCGGRGICGRCRVRFTDPASCPCPTDAERDLISEAGLKRGIRLACQAVIKGEAEIEIPGSSMITEGSAAEPDVKKIEPLSQSEVIAVDYGTTMISGALVDLNWGITEEASVINRQKAYGADVISRIKAAAGGFGEELRHVSLEDLAELSLRLGKDPEEARYVISGNTVMEHLLSGFSLKGLGEYPYTPVDISLRCDENITFLPGISAFVGADIVSGICACSLDKARAPWLYVDIGTNGEMALGAGRDVLAASAPAGPAFEGVGISCGMPAVPGAVQSAVIAGRRTVTSQVGNAKPCGICGSGVIDVIAGLRKNRMIDENGTLSDEFAEEGFPVAESVVMTQKDIREIQKAKAAIRSGIETLISESGVKREAIKKLVIAGSFGSGIDMANASYIGLIPSDLLSAAMTAGNASLTGATLYALDTGFGERLERLIGRTKAIELSEIPEFPARYISYMGI